MTENEANRADLHKDPAKVSGMFDQVAKRYDITNDVLSLGNDRFWRVATTRAVAPHSGQRILDLAAGTGASSVAFARSGAYVIAADFSPGMIAEAKRRYGHMPNLEFRQADATDLPFADGEFDTVTMSFWSCAAQPLSSGIAASCSSISRVSISVTSVCEPATTTAVFRRARSHIHQTSTGRSCASCAPAGSGSAGDTHA